MSKGKEQSMISRKEFIKFAGVAGAAALAGLALPGCGGSNTASSAAGSTAAASSASAAASASTTASVSSAASPRILVACFSATGNTRPIAEAAAQALGADYFEIEAAEPYTDDDLNYNDSSTRATVEQNNPDTRPAFASAPDFDAYDVVLIGHPIWWGKAPRLICNLLESGGMSGKTVAEFCTSGSSGIEGANAELKEIVPDANWIGARRFAAGTPDAEVADWVASLGIGA